MLRSRRLKTAREKPHGLMTRCWLARVVCLLFSGTLDSLLARRVNAWRSQQAVNASHGQSQQTVQRFRSENAWWIHLFLSSRCNWTHWVFSLRPRSSFVRGFLRWSSVCVYVFMPMLDHSAKTPEWKLHHDSIKGGMGQFVPHSSDSRWRNVVFGQRPSTTFTSAVFSAN